MVALGGLLIVIGFILLLPPGAFPGSTANQNVHMEGRIWRTPGYRRDVSGGRRSKLIWPLIGLGVMALGALCIELGS